MAENDGLIVPIVSPLTDDGSTLSEVRTAKMLRYYKERGAQGYLVGADAGEYMTLGLSERKELLEWIIRDCQGLEVVVNVTANATSATLDLCQHASRHGARAAVFALPTYAKFSLEEYVAHVQTIVRYGNIEVFIREIPSWDDETRKNFVAEVSTLSRAQLVHWPTGWPYSGGRVSTAPSIEEFGVGTSLVTPLAIFGPNAVRKAYAESPHLVAEMVFVLRAGLSSRVGRALLDELGVEVGRSRPPYRELPMALRERLRQLAKSLGYD